MALTVPLVGALVEVTYTGTVHSADDRGGFWLRVAEDCLTSALPSSAWVPAGATVKVLSPPRPREVLLLGCGHITDPETRITSALSARTGAFCLRCDRWEPQAAVGSVTWW